MQLHVQRIVLNVATAKYSVRLTSDVFSEVPTLKPLEESVVAHLLTAALLLPVEKLGTVAC